MTDPAAAYVHRKAAYDLVIDGASISPTVDPRLISLSLTERRGSDADELEIVLNDADGKLAIPAKGAQIILQLGWQDLVAGGSRQLIDKGTFTVDERTHEGTPDRLCIRARSADLTRAFRARRTETWQNTTLGQVLTDIASRHGWQPAIAADKAAVAVDHISQGRESDSAFLARLGRMHDALATVKAGRLLFAAIASGQTAGGTPIPPATLTRASGDRHRWQEAERNSASGVTADWHDRSTGQRRSVTVGSQENAIRLGRTYATETDARRAAETRKAQQERKAASFSLELAQGRPDLYPERQLTVSGWKPPIDRDDWLIVEVRHQLDAGGGLKTSLLLEVMGSPAAAQ